MEMETPYDQQKQAAGSLATITFIISAIYLFWSDTGFGSLFSLKALLFLGVGMFAAAIIIGIPSCLATRVLAKGLVVAFQRSPGAGLSMVATFLGYVVLIGVIVVTYLVTHAAYAAVIAQGAT